MNIGGELAFILQDINFSSKQDLLTKLRTLRESLKEYTPEERQSIRPILAVSIQQAFYISDWELMRYKEYLSKRSANEQNKNND